MDKKGTTQMGVQASSLRIKKDAPNVNNYTTEEVPETTFLSAQVDDVFEAENENEEITPEGDDERERTPLDNEEDIELREKKIKGLQEKLQEISYILMLLWC